jgi:hypothetical protein
VITAVSLGDLVVALPTGLFTIALGFCLAWWFSSFVIGGIDAPDAGDHGTYSGGSRATGSPRGSRASTRGRGAQRSGRSVRRGRSRSRRDAAAAVPLSLRWTVGATVGWIISLVLAASVRGMVERGTLQSILLVIAGVTAAAGARFGSRAFAGAVAPMFVTPEAPTRAALVGSIGRVRSLEVDEHHGEAKLMTGASAGAIVSVRADAGRFTSGDLVQLIAYDDDRATYRVAEVDDVLVPDDFSPIPLPESAEGSVHNRK